MATKIKGITIELNADASGLEKALKDIDKTLSQTQKDLKAVDKALALDPKNIELVSQKERLLGAAIDENKTKLNALKDAQKNIKWDDTKDAQRQYDALSREISQTEVKLRDLNTEQKQFSAEAAKARFGASNFGQALGTIQEKANQVAEATAQMSAAAGAALAGMAALVTKASQFADDMLTMSQQTGLSTDSLQKMSYAAERIDVPMETIVGSINKMKSGLDSNADVYQRLGVMVKDQRGQYRDIESIFFETVGALSRIENETERDTVAMDLFGKSANELAGIIDDGGAKLRELGKEADNLGMIIPEEDLEKLGEFNDKLEAMKSQLQMAGVKAALPVLEAMQPIITAISAAITKISAVLSNMNPTVVRILTIVLALIAAIAPVAKTIATITMAIQGLSVAIPLVSGALAALNGALATLLANPVTWIIAAIVAALALLCFGIYEAVKAWNSLGDTQEERLANAKEGIKNWAADFALSYAESHKGWITAWHKMSDAVNEFITSAKQKIEGFKQVLTSLGESFLRIPEKVREAAVKIRMWFEDLIDRAKQAGQDVMKGFADGVNSFIKKVVEAWQNMVKAVKNVWDSLTKDAANSGKTTAKAYSDAVNNNTVIKKPTKTNGFAQMSPSGSRPTGSAPVGASAQSVNALTSAVNMLNDNLSKMGGAQVNVELVGSAKNIFDTVRVQNNVLKTATGYHALA
jgi:phage-related minor tail protein